MGGLTRRGGVETASLVPALPSVSSMVSLVALSVLVDRWTDRDNFLGLLLAGILDMRKGMNGGPVVLLPVELELKYVGSVGWLGERRLT